MYWVNIETDKIKLVALNVIFIDSTSPLCRQSVPKKEDVSGSFREQYLYRLYTLHRFIQGLLHGFEALNFGFEDLKPQKIKLKH